MSLITDEIRKSASEMYHGDEICQVKSRFLLTEMNLPNGLLPLKDIIEVGYVEKTGFVWLIQRNKCEHKFEKIGRPVKYATEVTAYVEPNKIKKLTGVKSKELMVWLNICDIYLEDPSTGKITFKSPTGLSRSFPVSAFELEGEEAAAAAAAAAKVEAELEAKKKKAEEEEEVKEEVKEEKSDQVNGAAVVEVKEV